MDPSAIICRYQNSFDNNGTVPIQLHTYTTDTEEPMNTVKTNLKFSPESLDQLDKNGNTYYNTELNNKIKVDSLISNFPDLFDPFRNVSPKPFVNQDAVTLANMDMVFNFSQHTSGYIIKQESVKELSFAVIEDGPGGYAQYMMYRNPSCYGYGISHKHFNTDILDLTHFNIIPGESGRIQQDYKHFIKAIRTVEATGVDIVLGNYSDSVSGMGYLVRLLVALSVIKIGGTFICKIPEIKTQLMVDLLYITSQCFDDITLFKPISTELKDKDNIYYLVCKKAKTNNIRWVSYLEESYRESIDKNKKIEQLVDKVPLSFVKWIEEYNNLILLYKQYLIDTANTGVTQLYDTYKCKAIWNLPQI
jgi:hypothetical protein